MKEMPDLICGKAAVDRNYNSTRDTKLISVDGVAVPVPDNAEDILKCIYNEDWRIPNPNWKSNSGKCSKLLPNEYGYQSIK